jgi:hypothetical protein
LLVQPDTRPSRRTGNDWRLAGGNGVHGSLWSASWQPVSSSN